MTPETASVAVVEYNAFWAPFARRCGRLILISEIAASRRGTHFRRRRDLTVRQQSVTMFVGPSRRPRINTPPGRADHPLSRTWVSSWASTATLRIRWSTAPSNIHHDNRPDNCVKHRTLSANRPSIAVALNVRSFLIIFYLTVMVDWQKHITQWEGNKLTTTLLIIQTLLLYFSPKPDTAWRVSQKLFDSRLFLNS